MYKTQKDLENLFSWLLFYRDNKNIDSFKKCEKQIEELMKRLPKRNNK